MDYVHTKRLTVLEQLQRYAKMGAKARRDYVRKKRLPAFEQRLHGKKGAEVREEQWKPVRALAVKLAREGRFDTRREAAWAIDEQVLSTATEN